MFNTNKQYQVRSQSNPQYLFLVALITRNALRNR